MNDLVIPMLRRFCLRYIHHLMVQDKDDERMEHRLVVTQVLDDFLKWAEENQ